ncbi:hypothetical protein [Microbacterium sp.]|uniref:hypothetical protein n=1 Tax=Microbacterium sp. TaxID=51671 RepID=UPI0039E275E6
MEPRPDVSGYRACHLPLGNFLTLPNACLFVFCFRSLICDSFVVVWVSMYH